MVNEGFRVMDQPKEEPNKDTVLMIGVTSGTTGEPKLAMLTHLNFISGQVCINFFGMNFTPDDVYLSYVPLSHVYEHILHIDAIMFGFRIGYSSNNKSNLLKDIQKLKPTVFGTFPLFLRKIYDKINEDIESRNQFV